MSDNPTRGRWLALSAIVIIVLLIASGISPYDRVTWWLEVAPVLVALPLLSGTYRRFPLTTLVYVCIALHAISAGTNPCIKWPSLSYGLRVSPNHSATDNPNGTRA